MNCTNTSGILVLRAQAEETEKDFNNHTSDVHQGVINYECEICEKFATTLMMLALQEEAILR